MERNDSRIGKVKNGRRVGEKKRQGGKGKRIQETEKTVERKKK